MHPLAVQEVDYPKMYIGNLLSGSKSNSIKNVLSSVYTGRDLFKPKVDYQQCHVYCVHWPHSYTTYSKDCAEI